MCTKKKCRTRRTRRQIDGVEKAAARTRYRASVRKKPYVLTVTEPMTGAVSVQRFANSAYRLARQRFNDSIAFHARHRRPAILHLVDLRVMFDDGGTIESMVVAGR